MARASIRASPDERARSLPGDSWIPQPSSTVTHAITIRAPAERVWPWLAQAGGGRAGWYSIDRIDNADVPSASAILADEQSVREGDVFPALPGAKDAFVVTAVEPGREILLSGPGADGEPFVTWDFVLEPMGDGETRLITRARVRGGWPPAGQQGAKPSGRRAPVERVYDLLGKVPSPLAAVAGRAGHAVMEGRMLRGIKRRAELERGEGTRVLDGFLPRADVVERHQTVIRAPAGVVLEAAKRADPGDSPVVRSIFRARELLLGGKKAEADLPRGLVAQTTALGWRPLFESEHLLVMGAVTKPWQADVVFRGLAPDEYRAFDEPGWVKIAWTLEAEPLSPSQARFRTETRAFATDADARRRFRRYWLLVGRGVVIIRYAMLSAVRREVERLASARHEASP